MKKSVLKFGGLSALSIVVLFAISMAFLSGLSFGIQEIYGYLSILIALSFVFFGIKSYRDKELNGKISFGKALLMGMLISLIPSLAFGTFDVVYSTLINPDFYETYYTQMVQDVNNNYSGAELASKLAEMENMKDLTSNLMFGFFLMSVTVLLLGFVVSLISAVTLRRK